MVLPLSVVGHSRNTSNPRNWMLRQLLHDYVRHGKNSWAFITRVGGRLYSMCMSFCVPFPLLFKNPLFVLSATSSLRLFAFDHCFNLWPWDLLQRRVRGGNFQAACRKFLQSLLASHPTVAGESSSHWPGSSSWIMMKQTWFLASKLHPLLTNQYGLYQYFRPAQRSPLWLFQCWVKGTQQLPTTWEARRGEESFIVLLDFQDQLEQCIYNQTEEEQKRGRDTL